MATPVSDYREGSIGIPFSDMRAKIVKNGTTEEVAPMEEGEICVNGPAVMLGYLNHPEETAKTLQKHADGRIWLHTGDIGSMDADGWFYFKLREKRMLKVSGVNVYPMVVEEQIRKHPAVANVCVIGVPDKKQITRVKAIVVTKPGTEGTPAIAEEIKKLCRDNLLVYECPRDVEFRAELPTTLVGKIDFKKLEDAELEVLKAQGAFPFDGSA